MLSINTRQPGNIVVMESRLLPVRPPPGTLGAGRQHPEVGDGAGSITNGVQRPAGHKIEIGVIEGVEVAYRYPGRAGSHKAIERLFKEHGRRRDGHLMGQVASDGT